ncbi:hypothetical protein [Pseudarthrobacter sulfonivorans]|uniref:hypothetical protein n=1 Tax=Pseudarthrobacter sulfonivorans TaxID=121292 RepID=UPI00285D2E25|nr:hypothetical protein [Pseudarthrobacter sulfonivorans]MDR6416966.1 amino acid transporter [Pseudarthrobacter sulfonivorans]
MIISGRMQAMAAADGSFFGGFFGRFHPKLRMPIRVNTLSGVVGSWVAIFPGTLEVLFGLEYDFEATWGVSQFTFEAFALGTLGCVLALGLVGYARGKKVREAGAPSRDAAHDAGADNNGALLP